jgi:hypothetical protein
MSVVIATTAITIVAPNLIAFTRAATASAQLLSLIDRRSKINPFDDTGSRPNHVDGVLDMENVSFSYPTRPTVQVLKNFSLHVPAGKVTALVVRSPEPLACLHLCTDQLCRAPVAQAKAPLWVLSKDGIKLKRRASS